MKKRIRLLAVLLAAAMLAAFMPTLAYADKGDSKADGRVKAGQELSKAPAPKKTIKEEASKKGSRKGSSDEWDIHWWHNDIVSLEDEGEIQLYMYATYSAEIPTLECRWLKDGVEIYGWEIMELDYDYDLYDAIDIDEVGVYKAEVREKDDPGSVQSIECKVVEKTWEASTAQSYYDLYGNPVTLTVTVEGEPEGTLSYKWEQYEYESEDYTPFPGTTGTSLTVTDAGEYVCTVTDNGTGLEQYVWFSAESARITVGGLVYFAKDLNTAMLYWIQDDEVSASSITIPSTVVFGDGKARTVTMIDEIAITGAKYTSVTIPATVTRIDKYAVGYMWSSEKSTFVPVPGFVIFGTTGTAAHQYAINNGITFRDLAAEEAAAKAAQLAAWNGTPDSSIATAKASKPKAGKKSFTLKWKKLTKKQLKKGGVTNYEVQYSLNSSFPMNETQTKFISKKKGTTKVKGLQSKKTYYVRVRAIRNINGVKYVGKWSTKKVKVK